MSDQTDCDVRGGESDVSRVLLDAKHISGYSHIITHIFYKVKQFKDVKDGLFFLGSSLMGQRLLILQRYY